MGWDRTGRGATRLAWDGKMVGEKMWHWIYGLWESLGWVRGGCVDPAVGYIVLERKLREASENEGEPARLKKQLKKDIVFRKCKYIHLQFLFYNYESETRRC